MGKRKRDKAFSDGETTRRRRLLMWLRFPVLLAGAAIWYFTDAVWPAFALMGVWYAVFLIWAAGALDY